MCVDETFHEERLDPRLAELVPASVEIVKVSALPQGLLQLRPNSPRKPLELRLDQFRRMRLKDLLQPTPVADTRDLAAQRPLVPFCVTFKGSPAWKGMTLGHSETSWGLFLFEPEDKDGSGSQIILYSRCGT